eukprot:SAG25_NODE_486_length_7469_cov_4.137449_13_plen_83_part_00
MTDDGWDKTAPMDCGERMMKQVEMMRRAYPNSRSRYMIYRNFVKALPWLTVVREKLTNPLYSHCAFPIIPLCSQPWRVERLS